MAKTVVGPFKGKEREQVTQMLEKILVHIEIERQRKEKK
jgi:hypothetical protein